MSPCGGYIDNSVRGYAPKCIKLDQSDYKSVMQFQCKMSV